MKKLFLLRGVPASGKSTFLNQYKDVLDGFIISADQIRLIFSPTVFPKNQFEKKINPEFDKQVWNFIHERVQTRLLNGFTTIVDATHCNVNSIDYYKGFCMEHDISCTVIEFNTDTNICKERNNTRPIHQKVPEEVIDRMSENMKVPVPNWCNKITKEEFENILKSIQNNETDYTPLDYNKFDSIVIFGDIHGCYDPLKEYFKENPINSETKYIFVGDYEDRGIQNKEVFEFLLEHKKDSNFLFLKGNHTKNTLAYSIGTNVVSKEFRERTAKQLESFDKKELQKFCKRQGDFSYFTFCNQKFLVTHAGVPNIPNSFTNERDIVNGIGGYEDSEKVDETFRMNNPDVYTIHGHRNLHEVPFDIGFETGYFNLEGQVEFGGHLRIVSLDKTDEGSLDIKCQEIKNYTFRKIGTDEDIIHQLEDSRVVKIKELKNGIKGYSFTKDCFYDKRWDDLNTKARGLFCRGTKCVARSFDKFFNINERESLKEIADKMVYPVVSYRKENGYLGIVSYDKETDDLFVSSKNTNESDYAVYFKILLQETKDDKGVSLYKHLYDLLKRDNKYSLVFEICDSEKDPHMVYYKTPQIFLLEAFENSLKESTLDYMTLSGIADLLPMVKVKQIDAVLNTKDEFLSYVKTYESNKNEELEGFVLEDKNHYRVKYKTKWYKFWKYVRNHEGNMEWEDWIILKNFRNDIQDVSACMNKYEKKEFMIKNLIGQEAFSVIKLRNKIKEMKGN